MNRIATFIIVGLIIIGSIWGYRLWHEKSLKAYNEAEWQRQQSIHKTTCTMTLCRYDPEKRIWAWDYLNPSGFYNQFPDQESCVNNCMFYQPDKGEYKYK